MRLQLIAACAVLWATAACSDPPGPTVPIITGQYNLEAVDGLNGNQPIPISGMLQIGWNTPDGTYTIFVTQPAADSFSSFGSYTWDEKTLTLLDSASLRPLSNSVLGDDRATYQVTVQRGGHSYQFLRLPQSP